MPRLNRRFRGGRRNRAFNRFERRANNRKRKFAESMCELAAELDNSDNEEDEEAAAADCIEDIPDVTGYRMTRDEAEQGHKTLMSSSSTFCHSDQVESEAFQYNKHVDIRLDSLLDSLEAVHELHWYRVRPLNGAGNTSMLPELLETSVRRTLTPSLWNMSMGQTIWLHVMQSNVSNLLHSFYNISIDDKGIT